MLYNRNILFIAPDFFHYPEIITKRLQELGAVVDLFYDRPRSYVYKIGQVFHTYEYDVIPYWDKVLSELKAHYDYILVIKGDLIPESIYKTLRKRFSDGVFVQYHWDDIELSNDIRRSFSYFDKILTYNILDANEYGFQFRPFFFRDANDCCKEKSLDLFLIGSYNRPRYKTIKLLLQENDLDNIRLKKHIYINPMTFFHEHLPLKELTFFKFSKMMYDRMLRFIQMAKASIDIPFKSQKGLTTRSFESLPYRTKIITTNKNIQLYDFYFEENVQIIDAENPIIDFDWLNCPFRKINDDVLERYTLDSWINDVFSF